MQSTHQRTVRGVRNYTCVCGLAPTVDSRLRASGLSRLSFFFHPNEQGRPAAAEEQKRKKVSFFGRT